MDSADGYSLWRQDDNGQIFEVRRGLERPEAERIKLALEANPHKQIYWIAPTSGLSRGAVDGFGPP